MCEIFKNEKWPNLILIFPVPTCNFPRMIVVVKNSNLAEKKSRFANVNKLLSTRTLRPGGTEKGAPHQLG